VTIAISDAITSLKRESHQLCKFGLRHDFSTDDFQRWATQFSGQEEQLLAYLILRYLTYRSKRQLLSSFSQALYSATNELAPSISHLTLVDRFNTEQGLRVILTPVSPSGAGGGYVAPGGSSEVMLREVRQLLRMGSSQTGFLDQATVPLSNEWFIAVDDAVLSGDQCVERLTCCGMTEKDEVRKRLAICVAIAHETALSTIARTFPDIRVFYGERISSENSVASYLAKWAADSDVWPSVTPPQDVYKRVLDRAFPDRTTTSYADQDLLLAYEHGVPDNSCALLWEKSPTWQPLFQR
jgi:hypothetical protein